MYSAIELSGNFIKFILRLSQMAILPESVEDHSKDKIRRSRKMCGEYIDNIVRITIVVFGADFLQRLFHAAIEYSHHSRSYLPQDRVNVILARSFSYSPRTLWMGVGLLITIVLRCGSSGNLVHLLPSRTFLSFMPLYWIWNASQLGHSTLTYAHWIREPHGLDYAAGMASNYFHGYLKLALPEIYGDGLKKRMQQYEDTHNISFGIDRLVILLPDEMFVKGIIPSKILEKASRSTLPKPLEIKYINRGGVHRPFKHDVYKLCRKINNKTYYFVMEGATPMLSFFDAMNFQNSATWQMQEMKRDIWLKFAKHLKELLQTWPETRNLVELIIYNSHNESGDLVDVGEILYAQLQSRLEKDPTHD